MRTATRIGKRMIAVAGGRRSDDDAAINGSFQQFAPNVAGEIRKRPTLKTLIFSPFSSLFPRLLSAAAKRRRHTGWPPATLARANQGCGSLPAQPARAHGFSVGQVYETEDGQQAIVTKVRSEFEGLLRFRDTNTEEWHLWHVESSGEMASEGRS